MWMMIIIRRKARTRGARTNANTRRKRKTDITGNSPKIIKKKRKKTLQKISIVILD